MNKKIMVLNTEVQDKTKMKLEFCIAYRQVIMVPLQDNECILSTSW